MAKKFDAKAKAKRQKIILAVLGVVFIGVLAWQVPSVLKMMNEKPPAAATAPPPLTPVAGTPVAGTPVAATGAPPPAGTLVDSDPAAQPAGGQLVHFDRFESKDPFQQQLGDKPAAPASDDKRAPAGTPTGVAGSGGQSSSAPKPPAPALTSAEITVNGTKETVSVGGTFPQADPVFVLVSVTKTSAKVGVAGGSLDSGNQAVTLRKGKRLTLENTVDGARYTLVLVVTR
jgi:hypothetical protein